MNFYVLNCCQNTLQASTASSWLLFLISRNDTDRQHVYLAQIIHFPETIKSSNLTFFPLKSRATMLFIKRS